MPSTRRCPQCDRRLPYAGRRCRTCGWKLGAGVDESVARSTRLRRAAVLLGTFTLLLLGVGLGLRNADRVADWYAGFAARHLPERMTAFAPTDTERGAYLFCIRRVAARMDGEFSVETFPAMEDGLLIDIGDGRYRVESYVDEAPEDGQEVRRSFVCVVRHERGRWALEDLRLTSFAGVTAVGARSGN